MKYCLLPSIQQSLCSIYVFMKSEEKYSKTYFYCLRMEAAVATKRGMGGITAFIGLITILRQDQPMLAAI